MERTKRLIALEGIDGSGKSTLAKCLVHKLREQRYDVELIATREEQHEELFHEVINEYGLDSASPAYMFFFQMLHALKAERTNEALKAGKVVILDRWNLSFYVWHKNFGFFAQENDALREGISRLAFGALEPDLGLYLNVDVDVAIRRRIEKRGDAVCDIKNEKAFFGKVADEYRSLTKETKWVTLDANQEQTDVHKDAWNCVQDTLSC